MFDTKELFYTHLQAPYRRIMPRRVLIADDCETIAKSGAVLKSIKIEGVDVCVAVTNGIEVVEAAIPLRPAVRGHRLLG